MLAGIFQRTSFIAALTLCVPVSYAAAEVPWSDGDRVLFLGDSITQDGRYVDLIRGYVWAVYPERDITIINAGLSSETVSGITEPVHPYPRPNVLDRIDRALRLADPDWVLICYGMNDGIYHPSEARITDAYRQGLERVLAKIDAAGAKAILLSPPVFDAQAPAVVQRLSEVQAGEPYGYRNPFPQYDSTLVALANIARAFEGDPPVHQFIDVHAAADDFLKRAKGADPEFVYGDGVHPPLAGHLAIASAVLVGLGEEADQVDRVLARIFGLRPPGTPPQELPSAAAAAEIQEALLLRGRELSAAYRRAVDPETPEAEAQPLIDAAWATARERGDAIRKMIEQTRAAAQ